VVGAGLHADPLPALPVSTLPLAPPLALALGCARRQERTRVAGSPHCASVLSPDYVALRACTHTNTRCTCYSMHTYMTWTWCTWACVTKRARHRVFACAKRDCVHACGGQGRLRRKSVDVASRRRTCDRITLAISPEANRCSRRCLTRDLATYLRATLCTRMAAASRERASSSRSKAACWRAFLIASFSAVVGMYITPPPSTRSASDSDAGCPSCRPAVDWHIKPCAASIHTYNW
jgi:hypothetical protein